MNVTVSVTQEDIDMGNRDDPMENPVGLALMRLLRPVSEAALAGQGRLWFENGCVEINSSFGFEDDEDEEGAMSFHRVELPEAVNEFLDAFDALGPSAVKPFSFEIDIPDEELLPVLS